MGRTKKFLRNTMSTALYQIVVMFSGFITVSAILNVYGSEVNGLVSSVNQFIAYFKLVEAGLSSAAIYALYNPLAEKDYKRINSIVVAAKNLYTKAGYVFVILTIVLAIIYPIFVSLNALSSISIIILILILGVNGAIEFFTLAKYRVILTADQKTYVISFASTVYIIINTIVIVFLAKIEVNIVLLWFVTIFSILIRSLILIIYVRKKYKWINYNEIPNYKPLNKRWDSLYLQILGAIQVGAPIVILTLLTGDMYLVSIYSVYNMIIVGINGILGIFKTGLFASFGEVITKGEITVLQKAYREFELLYYCIIAVVFSIAFIMILPFINIYTDDVSDLNYELPITAFLFVLNGILYNLKNPQGMLVMSAGLFKETKLQTTIQGLILIVLGFLLTPFLGLEGVLIASIVSNLYRCIDLFVFIPRNVTKLPIVDTFERIIKMICSMIIIVIPFYFININPTNYLSWTLTSLVVGIYAVTIVGINSFMFDRKGLKSIVKRLVSTIKR